MHGSNSPEPGGVPGRRERKKREKLARIREAAEALFGERGFEAATVREIAERAGVASGTLFLYASDKRDLLFLVYEERIRATYEAALREVPAGVPLTEQLLFVFGRLFDLYAGDPALALRFVKEQFHGGGVNQRGMEEVRGLFLQRLAGLVVEAQRRGEVSRAVEPAVVVWSSFTLYFGALTAWLGGWAPREQAFHGMLRSALRLQHEGLAPRAGEEAEGPG
jgi:TetR/AcrR family transcriptional regulator, cholesterol catabolism regulator